LGASEEERLGTGDWGKKKKKKKKKKKERALTTEVTEGHGGARRKAFGLDLRKRSFLCLPQCPVPSACFREES
jgi:hypothetical protein